MSSDVRLVPLLPPGERDDQGRAHRHRSKSSGIGVAGDIAASRRRLSVPVRVRRTRTGSRPVTAAHRDGATSEEPEDVNGSGGVARAPPVPSIGLSGLSTSGRLPQSSSPFGASASSPRSGSSRRPLTALAPPGLLTPRDVAAATGGGTVAQLPHRRTAVGAPPVTSASAGLVATGTPRESHRTSSAHRHLQPTTPRSMAAGGGGGARLGAAANTPRTYMTDDDHDGASAEAAASRRMSMASTGSGGAATSNSGLMKVKVSREGDDLARLCFIPRAMEFGAFAALIAKRCDIPWVAPRTVSVVEAEDLPFIISYADDEGDRIVVDTSELKRLLCDMDRAQIKITVSERELGSALVSSASIGSPSMSGPSSVRRLSHSDGRHPHGGGGGDASGSPHRPSVSSNSVTAFTPTAAGAPHGHVHHGYGYSGGGLSRRDSTASAGNGAGASGKLHSTAVFVRQAPSPVSPRAGEDVSGSRGRTSDGNGTNIPSTSNSLHGHSGLLPQRMPSATTLSVHRGASAGEDDIDSVLRDDDATATPAPAPVTRYGASSGLSPRRTPQPLAANVNRYADPQAGGERPATSTDTLVRPRRGRSITPTSGTNAGHGRLPSRNPAAARAASSRSGAANRQGSTLASTSATSSKESEQSQLQRALTQLERDKIPWTRLGVIGKGAYGTVFEGVLQDGEHVAVKVLDVPQVVSAAMLSGEPADEENDDATQQVKKLIREINLMRHLKHPNIVAYRHCHMTRLHDDTHGGTGVSYSSGSSAGGGGGGGGTGPLGPHSDVTSTMTVLCGSRAAPPLQIEIMMELCPGGTLSQVVRQAPGRHLPAVQARRYAQQILQGLVYLHSRGVIHRDVKAENVLIGLDGVAKLADFGCSRRIAAATSTITMTVDSHMHGTGPSSAARSGRYSANATTTDSVLSRLDSQYVGSMDGMAHTMVGTPLFMAPEVILQDLAQSESDLGGGAPTMSFPTFRAKAGSASATNSVLNTANASAMMLETLDKKTAAGKGGDDRSSGEGSTSGGYAAPADIWAVGCLVLELFGRTPWPLRPGSSYIQVLFRIAQADKDKMPPGVPDNGPPALRAFLEKCFQRDPRQRASARELLKTEWMTCPEDSLEEVPPPPLAFRLR